MALGNIELLRSKYNGGNRPTEKCNVAAGADTIYPGEPVVRALGAATVTAMADAKPVVATDYVIGIASSESTQSATVAGTVEVVPLDSQDVWLIAPKTAASFDTQAEYDALVGDRVLMDLTSSEYTLEATDGATYGCVIQPLDIAEYPGKVAFKFRAGLSDVA